MLSLKDISDTKILFRYIQAAHHQGQVKHTPKALTQMQSKLDSFLKVAKPTPTTTEALKANNASWVKNQVKVMQDHYLKMLSEVRVEIDRRSFSNESFEKAWLGATKWAVSSLGHRLDRNMLEATRATCHASAMAVPAIPVSSAVNKQTEPRGASLPNHARLVTTVQPPKQPNGDWQYVSHTKRYIPTSTVRLVSGPQDPLSNFFPCTIMHRGVKHHCLEQAYQMEKAQHFGHMRAWHLISKSKDAFEAKQLANQFFRGRVFSQVCRDRPEIAKLNTSWKGTREKLMLALLREKAQQCPKFTDSLCNSGHDSILHNVYDNWWGTGSRDRSVKGLNVFGRLLEDIRSELGRHLTKSDTNQECNSGRNQSTTAELRPPPNKNNKQPLSEPVPKVGQAARSLTSTVVTPAKKVIPNQVPPIVTMVKDTNSARVASPSTSPVVDATRMLVLVPSVSAPETHKRKRSNSASSYFSGSPSPQTSSPLPSKRTRGLAEVDTSPQLRQGNLSTGPAPGLGALAGIDDRLVDQSGFQLGVMDSDFPPLSSPSLTLSPSPKASSHTRTTQSKYSSFSKPMSHSSPSSHHPSSPHLGTSTSPKSISKVDSTPPMLCSNLSHTISKSQPTIPSSFSHPAEDSSSSSTLSLTSPSQPVSKARTPLSASYSEAVSSLPVPQVTPTLSQSTLGNFLGIKTSRLSLKSMTPCNADETEYETSSVLRIEARSAEEKRKWELPRIKKSTLVIGDSNISNIKKIRRPLSNQVQLVSYPGAKVEHFYEILKKQTIPVQGVKNLILNVGLNNRSQKALNTTGKHIKSLHFQCKRVFPAAKIYYAAIGNNLSNSDEMQNLKDFEKTWKSLGVLILPCLQETVTTKEGIHWTIETACNLMDLWMTTLALN